MTILLNIAILATSSTMEQPGRMFNKTLNLNLVCDNDSFFMQEKRRQQQQHQQQRQQQSMNSIPLYAPPTTKSCGGVLLERSPVSVKDVKRFDVVNYEEDCGGGVAIDLCDDVDDVDDLLPLQEQEEEQQRLASCQQQQQRLQVQVQARRPSVLAPIFEERHVTFAAQHVVSKVNASNNNNRSSNNNINNNNNNNNNDCGVDQRFVHQVFDAVQMWFIPHHEDYSEEERSNMWYSQLEMYAMKENAIDAKRSSRREKMKAQQKQLEAKFEAELDNCFSPLPALLPFSRGIGMMWKKQKQNSSKNSKNKNNSESDDEFHPDCRRCRYEETLDAVLQEQYEQRMMCLRVYGRVDHGYSGILDHERLARVYSIVGDTQRCQERAVAKARKSLLQEQQQEEEDENNNNSSSSSSSIVDTNHNHATSPSTTSSSTSTTTRSKPSSTIKRSASFNSKSSLSLETSNILDKSVNSLFQVLLTPFIEMRQGDLFLGIGEEMSIEI